jgi:type II secretory pathway component PulJ
VKYQMLDSMLLNELQKEHQQIREQSETIRQLQKRLAALEATLSTYASPSASVR